MKIVNFCDAVSSLLIDPHAKDRSDLNKGLAWAATIILGIFTLGIAQGLSALWRRFRPVEMNDTHELISRIFARTVRGSKDEVPSSSPKPNLPKDRHPSVFEALPLTVSSSKEEASSSSLQPSLPKDYHPSVFETLPMTWGYSKTRYLEELFVDKNKADHFLNHFYELYQSKAGITIDDIETADKIVEIYSERFNAPNNRSQMEKIAFISSQRKEALVLAVMNAKESGRPITSDCRFAKEGHYSETVRGREKVNFYSGPCLEGKPNGEGFMVYPTRDGSYTYSGEFVDGKQMGFGVGIHANGRRYAGDFRDTKRHGIGIFTAEPGGFVNMEPKGMVVKYSGDYQNGLAHGHGCIEFFNGTQWKGTFNKNQPVGKGIFVSQTVSYKDIEWESVLRNLQRDSHQ